jgi:hypothetical protein
MVETAMHPVFILSSRLNLGNALSAYGSFCLLADEIKGAVLYDYFSNFQDLFSVDNIKLFDPNNFIDNILIRDDIARLVKIQENSRFISKITDFEIIHKDKYFCYSKYDESTVVLTRTSRYYSPLEAVDKTLLQNFAYVLVQKPYHMQYQIPRDSSALSSFFALSEKKINIICNSMIEYYPGEKTVIGIHVRHGDYMHWRSGRYWYTIKQYKKIIHSLEKAKSESAQILFYIASNADHTLNFKRFISAPRCKIFLSKASYIDDFIALSISTLIVGPPSSFGHWAAFLGKKKRYVLDSLEYQKFVINEIVLDRLPIVTWPFSAGLKNDFWQE